MLTGEALLERVNAQRRVSNALIAECGYVVQRGGKEVSNRNAFYQALLEAKGVPLGDGEPKRGRGAKASYRTRVHFNGNLMVLSCYVEQLGAKPGDQFEIKIGNGQIRLVPFGDADAAPADELEQRRQERECNVEAGAEGAAAA